MPNDPIEELRSAEVEMLTDRYGKWVLVVPAADAERIVRGVMDDRDLWQSKANLTIAAQAQPAVQPPVMGVVKHLDHQAYESLLKRIDEYDEDDWERAGKFERHAMNAAADIRVLADRLAAAGAENTRLQQENGDWRSLASGNTQIADLQQRLEQLQMENEENYQSLRATSAYSDDLKQRLEQAQASLKNAEGWIEDVREREAACCPEDVGFDEYIATLKRQLEQAQAERNEAVRQRAILTNEVEEYHAQMARYDEQVAVLREERERWRPVSGIEIAIGELEQKFCDDGDALYALRLLRKKLSLPAPPATEPGGAGGWTMSDWADDLAVLHLPCTAGSWCGTDGIPICRNHQMRPMLIAALRDRDTLARAEGYAKAIEDAAKVVDAKMLFFGMRHLTGSIIEAIRALVPKEPTQ